MKKNESELDSNPEQDLINLKLDHNDQNHSGPTEDEKPMDDVIAKTARLAKINLLLTVIGFSVFGYLHFTGMASTDEAIAKSTATLKKEVVADMKEGLASTEELQVLAEKNTALEVKVNEYADKIANLEMQTQQFQVELDKNANLRSKVNELQSSLKKSKPAEKSTKTKTKAPAKPAKKGRK
jgi:predicted RNase H-like nuclease (RuvC/YqgF family)